MQGVGTTKTTILAELQFFRSSSFIFCRCIVASLTLGTRKSDNISHFLILYLNAGINFKLHVYFYSMIELTTPAPTVRPPSRIAKRSPSSIAIGVIRFTVIATLSPGMTISVPSGSSATPVTSVVRK